jgi:hypothetical protein
VYDDARPCHVCGSAVRLEPHRPDPHDPSARVGPSDGVVGGADPTLDDRVCSNDDCPTRSGDGEP